MRNCFFEVSTVKSWCFVALVVANFRSVVISFKDFVKSCPKLLLRRIWLISEFRDQDLLSKYLLILFKRKGCKRFLRYTTLCCVGNFMVYTFSMNPLRIFEWGFNLQRLLPSHGRLPKSGYKGVVLKTTRPFAVRGFESHIFLWIELLQFKKIISEEFRMFNRVKFCLVRGIHFQWWLLHSLSRFWLVPS